MNDVIMNLAVAVLQARQIRLASQYAPGVHKPRVESTDAEVAATLPKFRRQAVRHRGHAHPYAKASA